MAVQEKTYSRDTVLFLTTGIKTAVYESCPGIDPVHDDSVELPEWSQLSLSFKSRVQVYSTVNKGCSNTIIGYWLKIVDGSEHHGKFIFIRKERMSELFC